jgi:hypothetical protein
MGLHLLLVFAAVAVILVAILALLPFAPARILRTLSHQANPFCKAMGLYGLRRANRHLAVIIAAAELLRHRFIHHA